MTFNIKASVFVASMVFYTSSQAGLMTYEVTNFNQGNGKHALWTNKDYSTDNTFSANNDLFFSIDDKNNNDVSDDIARLYGSTTATGFSPDLVATIDLTFSGGFNMIDFSQNHYKQEGGLAYNDLLANNPTFWDNVLGSITIGNSVYDIDSHVVSNNKNYMFQFGVGANAKSKTELGGSSWVQSCKREENALGANTCMESHHWDLNLGFKATDVPEPGILSLIATAFTGLLVSRRRRLKLNK